jgi:hypothetical protein
VEPHFPNVKNETTNVECTFILKLVLDRPCFPNPKENNPGTSHFEINFLEQFLFSPGAHTDHS